MSQYFRQERCGRCSAEASLGVRGRRSFVLAQSKPHYAPDVPLRLEAIAFDLEVDPKAKTLAGKVTQSFTVVAPEVSQLRLDQMGL